MFVCTRKQTRDPQQKQFNNSRSLTTCHIRNRDFQNWPNLKEALELIFLHQIAWGLSRCHPQTARDRHCNRVKRRNREKRVRELCGWEEQGWEHKARNTHLNTKWQHTKDSDPHHRLKVEIPKSFFTTVPFAFKTWKTKLQPFVLRNVHKQTLLKTFGKKHRKFKIKPGHKYRKRARGQ